MWLWPCVVLKFSQVLVFVLFGWPQPLIQMQVLLTNLQELTLHFFHTLTK